MGITKTRLTVTATAPIDVANLKRQIDLLELIGRDTPLRKVASTEGGEYAGPHAACGGGTDRLRVQPQRRRWWCRVCSPDEHWQDAISYVQQRDGVTFREAVERLGGAVANVNSKAASDRCDIVTSKTGSDVTRFPEPDPEPSAEWRERATSHIERCQMALWGPTGAEALAYLRNARHLRDDTIRSWRLGWNDQAVWEPRPRWGLEADGDRKYVWIPRGITIPWFCRGQLWQFKVRRPDEDLKTKEDKRRRYISVAGGHPFLYGADTLEDHDIIILPEGEFDTLLLWQEARHLVGTATLGSAQKGIPRRALPYLLAADHLLIAYDVDDAGEKGAASITSMSSRIARAKTPIGNDITEFVAAGGRLHDWISFHLTRLGVAP